MNPESLDAALAKRDSCAHIWTLLNPKPQYHNLFTAFMREWNKRSHRQQQQFYWFIREKLRKGEVVHDNPLYALTYIIPHPFDRNWDPKAKEMINSGNMVSAFYNGHFGVYTRCEATIFEMTHVTPLLPLAD